MKLRSAAGWLARGWRRALRSPRGVAPLGTQDDAATLSLVRKHDYYWYNAQKKVDLRRIDRFGPLAERVRREGRTYLHVDRLYTLWQAIASMPSHATAVVEVGVFKGGSTSFLARGLSSLDRDVAIYACDTFSGHATVDETVDGRHGVGRQFTGVRLEDVRAYLQDCPAVTCIAGDIQETAGALDHERAIGLLHIDVDVYPPTRFCLERLAPRLVAGGTVVVDDYGFKTCGGVKIAVDEFAAAHPEFRLLHLLTGQAVLVRLA